MIDFPAWLDKWCKLWCKLEVHQLERCLQEECLVNQECHLQVWQLLAKEWIRLITWDQALAKYALLVLEIKMAWCLNNYNNKPNQAWWLLAKETLRDCHTRSANSLRNHSNYQAQTRFLAPAESQWMWTCREGSKMEQQNNRTSSEAVDCYHQWTR